MWAQNGGYAVYLRGTCQQPGTLVRVPTPTGLQFCCRDTTQGQLHLELRHQSGQLVVQATSNLAGLEVGGDTWQQGWYH
jgi:tocopherol cyclase